MKNIILSLCISCFAFTNVLAQELPKPKIATPEKTFYDILDNESISNPEKYNGNVKKVVRTFKEYMEGVTVTTERMSMFVNKNNQLEKTIRQTYSYGIEDFKKETNHLESPKTTNEKKGNQLIKIIKQELPEDLSENYYDLQGDEKYVYENDLLVAYYTNNDSISYTYDDQNRLIQTKQFESLIAEEFNEDDYTTTYYRSAFEDKALERITYKDDHIQSKIIYDKFGEVIDIYETTYTYGKANRIENFKIIYKRYLFDYYEPSVAIEKQAYDEFPRVSTIDSIQTGVFKYTDTNKMSSYEMNAGLEKESYTIAYDDNDRLYWVEGFLQFVQQGKVRKLEVAYEYSYDELGNPKTIKSYFYQGGEKMLHRETTFEIEYYE